MMDRQSLLNLMNQRKQHATLELVEVATGHRQTLAQFDQVIEAPNWTRDGQALVYNSNGRIFRLDLGTKSSVQIDTGFADLCNNDHVISFDGRWLAISHFAAEDLQSRIYVLPLAGGTPRCVTAKAPSYLHGWSPDGQSLVYCANRGAGYHIFQAPITGEGEIQLTSGPGNDDGPEYAPDGKSIWFNSTRSGLMQIWRMDPMGHSLERMTHLEMNCWFPHLSPDGKSVAYLAYHPDDLQPEEHLPDKPVEIRIMAANGANDRKLLDLAGGQGTINVNSWSPDGRYLAFVSYSDL